MFVNFAESNLDKRPINIEKSRILMDVVSPWISIAGGSERGERYPGLRAKRNQSHDTVRNFLQPCDL